MKELLNKNPEIRGLKRELKRAPKVLKRELKKTRDLKSSRDREFKRESSRFQEFNKSSRV